MKHKTRGTEIECQMCTEETCFGCPLMREEAEAVKAVEWDIPICTDNHIREAADAIEQLVADNVKMRQEYGEALNQVSAVVRAYDRVSDNNEVLRQERDAAVADLHHVLMSLGYDATIYGESVCRYCKHHNEKFGECQQDCNSSAEKWEWRGVHEHHFREVKKKE